MHFLPLSLKRAHWASIKLLKPLAAKFDLTPARFDLLYCALKMRGTAYQSTLARKLGVSKTTVCKMLGAMEEAGLVVRLDRNVFDRRYRRWNVTERGRDCLRGLLKVIRRGFLDVAILTALAGPHAPMEVARALVVEAATLAVDVAVSFDDALPMSLFPYHLEMGAADLRARQDRVANLRAR